MVKEYLEKTRNGFMEEKIALMEQVTFLQNSMKQNIQMIQLLEDTNDPNIESFTPRQVNGYNRKKLGELQDEQKELITQLNQLRADVSTLDMKIDEINSVLKVVREDEYSNEVGPGGGNLSSDMKMAVLQSVERERQRIARDLHDTTVQSLTSLVHKTELCLKLLDVDPIRCRLELSSTGKILKDVINDARRMIYDLRPMSFDDMGFDITVERFLDKFRASNPIKITYETEGDSYSIDTIIALSLLRVIQEASNNAVKHANANHVEIIIKYLEDEIYLKVTDDGDGFDVTEIPETTRDDNSGFGLAMMRERIFMLSGQLEITSEIGKGSCVEVHVPIKKEDK